MHSIQIVEQYRYHASVVFGLDVLAPSSEFPLLVGCSVRSRDGKIVDIPAQWLKSPGSALWNIKAPPECQISTDPWDKSWSGQIIFALWQDDTFTKRLADTGWVNWEALWLIGSSTKGLDMQDEQIKSKSAGRMDVWVKR